MPTSRGCWGRASSSVPTSVRSPASASSASARADHGRGCRGSDDETPRRAAHRRGTARRACAGRGSSRSIEPAIAAAERWWPSVTYTGSSARSSATAMLSCSSSTPPRGGPLRRCGGPAAHVRSQRRERRQRPVGSAGERDRRGGGAHLLEMAAEQLGPVGTNVLVGQDTAVAECIDGECPDDTQLGVARVGEAVGEEGSVVGWRNASASRMVLRVSAPRRRSSASSASSPGARSSEDRVTPR